MKNVTSNVSCPGPSKTNNIMRPKKNPPILVIVKYNLHSSTNIDIKTQKGGV